LVRLDIADGTDLNRDVTLLNIRHDDRCGRTASGGRLRLVFACASGEEKNRD
jgi:hypothetical protein